MHTPLCMCMPAQSCPTVCDPVDCSPPDFSVHRFSRQEYWSGWACPSPADLSDPGIKSRSAALQADSLLSEPSLLFTFICCRNQTLCPTKSPHFGYSWVYPHCIILHDHNASFLIRVGLKKKKIEVQLNYNVVLVSGISKVFQFYIYIYTHTFSRYWIWFPVLYSKSLLFICFIFSSV